MLKRPQKNTVAPIRSALTLRVGVNEGVPRTGRLAVNGRGEPKSVDDWKDFVKGTILTMAFSALPMGQSAPTIQEFGGLSVGARPGAIAAGPDGKGRLRLEPLWRMTCRGTP